MSMNPLVLTGKSKEHLDSTLTLHKKLAAPLKAMSKAAQEAGFELKVASGFRSFDHQLKIWNQKILGERPLLDEQGKTLEKAERDKLSPWSLLTSMMRWSAIPGASRHHWGSDIDVYDQKKVKTPSLTPQEATGSLNSFYTWLDENMHRWDFFRPYKKNLGGVCPEPWHLSYAPISQPFLEQYSLELFERTVDHPALQLKELILESPQEIYHRYIQGVSPPPFSFKSQSD